MGWRVEVVRLVEELRSRLGITGLAEAQDALALADLLELEVRRVPGLPAHLCVEKARIILPTGLDRRQEAAMILEECGHWLFRGYEHFGAGNRGYLLGDGKAENPATAFALCWQFAGAEGTDEDVARERGCPLELVGKYRQLQLAG